MEREGAVAFSVISIEPERNSRQRGSPSRRPGVEEEEGVKVEDGDRGREGGRAYEDENEMNLRQVSRCTSLFVETIMNEIKRYLYN